MFWVCWADELWCSFFPLLSSVTLQGSDLHWLACSLYVACRSSVPTVGKGTSEGNYVSLTRILRCSEMRCASYSPVALFFPDCVLLYLATLLVHKHCFLWSTSLILLHFTYSLICILQTASDSFKMYNVLYLKHQIFTFPLKINCVFKFKMILI